jgi:hypothetical protein
MATFADVIKFSSVRMLLALIEYLGLKLHHKDFVTAFLYEDIASDIHVEIPSQKFKLDDVHVGAKIEKWLYQLKSSPRLWNRNPNHCFHVSMGGNCVHVLER